MKYKGVEIKITKSGKFMIQSPVNGTTRIFKNKELLMNYIDNAQAIDFMAKHMN